MHFFLRNQGYYHINELLHCFFTSFTLKEKLFIMFKSFKHNVIQTFFKEAILYLSYIHRYLTEQQVKKDRKQ